MSSTKCLAGTLLS